MDVGDKQHLRKCGLCRYITEYIYSYIVQWWNVRVYCMNPICRNMH